MRNRRTSVLVAATLAMAGAISGCGGSEPPSPAAAPAPAATTAPAAVTGEDRVAWYQDCWGRFNARTWDAFKACYDPAVTSEAPDSGRPAATGPDAVVAALEPFLTAFPDIKGTPQLVLSNGEHTAGLYLMTATHTGPLAGPGGKTVPPTGKPLGYMLGHVIRARATDRKATEERSFVNDGTMLAQLGVVPGPSRPVMTSGNVPVVVIAGASSVEATNLAAFRGQMEAFNRHDVAAAGAFNAADAVFHDYTSPQDMDTKANAMMLDGFFTGFPDCRLSTTSLWAANDYVVAEGTFEGTNTGAMPAMGIRKPTGKPVRVRFLEITRYRDGKVAEDWLIFNGMSFATQLGLMGS